MTVGIAEFGVPVGEVKLDTDDVALEVVVGLPLSAKLSPDEVVWRGCARNSWERGHGRPNCLAELL